MRQPLVIAEADGSAAEALAGRDALLEALSPDALALGSPIAEGEIADLRRWRDGVGLAADAALGGKVSEDIGVPIDRLPDAIEGTKQIGKSHGLAKCSWGHAGDGNLHSAFLYARDDIARQRQAVEASQALFEMAVAFGGTVSGEHGIGLEKGGQLRRQWAEAAADLHDGIKRLFDPAGLLNPRKESSR